MEPSNRGSRRRRSARRNPRAFLDALSEVDDSSSGWPAGRPPPPPPPPLAPSRTPSAEGASGLHPHRGQALSSASPPPQPCPRVPSRRDARTRRGHLGETGTGTGTTRVHVRQSHLYAVRPSRPRGPSEPTLVVSSSGLVSLESLPGFTSDRVCGNDLSRFNLPSLDDVPPASDLFDGHDGDNNDEPNIGEGAVVVRQYNSDDDSDEDGDIWNPFCTDRFGNLTTWRLSDLEAAFVKHLEDEASKPKPKEKKYSKEERLKIENECIKQYMKSALEKYNNEEDLAGEMCFEFEEIEGENIIIEGGGLNFYQHFNFLAKQAGSIVLFFAEVIPDEGDTCEVLCCKPLDDNDNGHCFGCKNQGVVQLRHPACKSLYTGGHVDCVCPFMLDSSSEDDCD